MYMGHFAGKLLIAAVLASTALWAQEPERGPDGTANTHVPGVSILPIAGKPFSGVDHIEWTRMSDNGTAVTKHLQAMLARDSQGRTYREHHTFVPGGSPDQAPLNYIHVDDPITRMQMTCYLRTYVCDLYPYAPKTVDYPSSVGWIDDRTRFRTRESLGTDQYQGFDVAKSREVTATRAGAAGNDRELIETREFWYCEALQTNLKILRSDPLTGRQLVYVDTISLSEPNPELFKVPIGYSVHDLRRRTRSAISERTTP
jgi:hypothetical protein